MKIRSFTCNRSKCYGDKFSWH